MKNVKVVYVIGPEVSGEQGILRKISEMEKRHTRRSHIPSSTTPIVIPPSNFSSIPQTTTNTVFQMTTPYISVFDYY